MILKTLVLTGLVLSMPVSFAKGREIFKVAPYTLKHTNGHLLLNFQLNEGLDLSIDDNGVDKGILNYKKNKHYQIELGDVACGSVRDVQINMAKTQDVLYKNSWAAIPCTTSDSSESMVFGFISDTQQFTERHEQISQVIAAQHAIEPLQFLINGGDVVQEGDTEEEWIKYFLGGQAYLRDIPQIAAIGNHDYRGYKGAVVPKYFQQFMRWNGSDKNGNLFFDFPKAQFLILNSNFTRFNNKEEDAIWSWVEAKAAYAKKIKKPLIIATHFPVHSSSLNRFISTAVIQMNNKLVPIAEKYKLPLILSGHTHMYERSYKNGVHYLVAGPAGGRANSPSRKNKYMRFFDKDALTFTKIKLTKGIFKIETYNQDNRMIDSLVIRADGLN